MTRDSVSHQGASPTHESPAARPDHSGRPSHVGVPDRRRDSVTRLFARLGFADLAARFEHLPVAMSITRVSDGRIRVMNDHCMQLIGHSHANHIGKTTIELPVWADPGDRERFVASLLEHGEVTDMEALLHRADGATVPVLLSGRPIEDLHGEQSVFCVAHDLTGRKRAEEALRHSEEHYRSIFTMMDEGAILVDRSGLISSANPAAQRILGVAAEGLLGISPQRRMAMTAHIRPDGSTLPPEEHPAIAVLQTGAPQSGCVMGVSRPDGSLVWISVNALALAGDGDSGAGAVLSTFRDITARVKAETELRRREAELERMLEERTAHLAIIERSLASAVRVACEIVETRDPYTGGHQRRVSELATRIAQAMGSPAAQVEEIRIAALIHDIGTMAVPIEILSKPGPLSPLEFSLIRVHAEAGYGIVNSAEMAGATAEIVLQHHERCDGSGYPRGLSGDALLPGAKVLMVADVVEAMASHRPYRAALGLDAAMEELAAGAGSRYDADVCRACTDIVREQGFAFSEPQG